MLFLLFGKPPHFLSVDFWMYGAHTILNKPPICIVILAVRYSGHVILYNNGKQHKGGSTVNQKVVDLLQALLESTNENAFLIANEVIASYLQQQESCQQPCQDVLLALQTTSEAS